MSQKPHSTPSTVEAEDGEVLVDGPDGVALSFTPDAAIETSHRLQRAGADAKRQSEPDKPREAPDPSPGE